MPTVYVTRKTRFSAAHRYHRPEWSDERNHQVFGPCSNAHGHGHNYVLEVTVAGAVDSRTGFSVNLAVLDGVLRDRVVVPLDHRHLNYDIARFAPGGQIPTTENLAAWIWEQLQGSCTGATLVRLRLHEDETLYVDYFGPDADAPPPSRVVEV